MRLHVSFLEAISSRSVPPPLNGTRSSLSSRPRGSSTPITSPVTADPVVPCHRTAVIAQSSRRRSQLEEARRVTNRSRPHVEERGMTGGQAVTTRWRLARRHGRHGARVQCLFGGRRDDRRRPRPRHRRRPRRSRPARRPPRRPVAGRGPGHHRVVAHLHQRSGQDPVQEHRGRLHGGPPERHHQHHGPRERGVQDQARDPDAVGHAARPVPVVGRRHDGRPGRRRNAQGHHRRRRLLEGHRQRRRA